MKTRQKPISRRRFLKFAAGATAGVAAAGLGYTGIEAGWFRVARERLLIPHLPVAFAGRTAAFLTDIHHGTYTGIAYVRSIVQTVNKLAPDVILLGGDYVHLHARYIRPCFEALQDLRAPLGVFGVLGNHDHWTDAPETRKAMRESGIMELTNTGVWLGSGDARLRLGGVGDLWEDTQDLQSALGDAGPEDACLLLSHNPDFAETLTDRRVGLVLSGHTHGGQVVLPYVGAPYVPSRYGQKYLHGLVQAPCTQAYVSRGLGTINPPLRFGCRPEINLLELA